MRIETAVIHAGESYLPDTLKLEPYRTDVAGYGYNDDDDFGYLDDDPPNTTVVIEADTLEGSHALWLEYAIGCSAIHGADDDHYDYWPSNFSGLVHLGLQLDELMSSDRCMIVCRMIWDNLTFARWEPNRETLEACRADFADEIMPRP